MKPRNFLSLPPMRVAAWLILTFCASFYTTVSYASPIVSIRFEKVKISNGDEPALNAGIWSPTGLAEKKKSFLIVMSHGGGGNYLSNSDTAIALAKAGFVAAAVDHAGDETDDQSRVLQLWRRPQQLHRLIDYMLEEWPDRKFLNNRSVGAFGFSNGGFTVIVAAGGRPNLGLINPYCGKNPHHDLCAAIRGAGLDPVRLKIPLSKRAWISDNRIKAIVAAAPAFGFTFTQSGLSDIHIPIQLWRPADDHHQPFPYYAEAIEKALPRPADYRVVPQAGHYDFLPPCSRELEISDPAICRSANGFDRSRFHADLNAAIIKFFQNNLGE